MKINLLIILVFLLHSIFGWCGGFEDTVKSAKKGNTEAQLKLGSMYKFGQGVPIDYNKAVYWFTKAAEQGSSSAQFALGGMYKFGEGVPIDYKKAAYWFTKAAAQGYAPAQLFIGRMHFSGQGIPKDLLKAVYWLTKAAEQGEANAQQDLGTAYFIGQGVSIDYQKGIYWLTKAAEQGKFESQAYLGFIYSESKIVPKDYKKAVYWYTKAAEHGLADAQYNLGIMYHMGEGVPQDYAQAVYWLTKAAEQGYVDAQRNLGTMYYNGEKVVQDYKQAFYWSSQAAEQGDATAQYNIGLCYWNGRGVLQNYILAYVWFSLSASQGVQDSIRFRNIIANELSSQQLIEAQELAGEIQYKITQSTEPQKSDPSVSNVKKNFSNSGTGFIITNDGYILTCYHVVKDERDIRVVFGGKILPAKLVVDDPHNDLALLKIDGYFPALAFSLKRPAKMGEKVFTIGYPIPSLQGINAKYTSGTLSSLTGFQDDVRLYQIDVPVQPGNSGGPLVDENGNILGIIVSILDAKTIFKITGTLPQNVNYAIKSIYAIALLDTLPGMSEKLVAQSKVPTNVIDKVKKSCVMILCYPP